MYYFFVFCILCLGWLYPFHYAPWLVAENEFFILLIPIILSFRLLKYKKIEANGLLIFPVFLIFFSFFQFFLIDYYLEDFILISIYSLFIVLMLIISQNYRDGVSGFLFLKALVLLTIINSIIVLLQYFDFENIFVLNHTGDRRFHGNVGQPNHLSTLFLMGVVSCFLLYKNKKIKKITLYALSIYLVFFIFLTGSRTGLLTLFLLIFIVAAVSTKEDFRFNVSFFCFLNIFYLILSKIFSVNSRNTVNSLGTTLNDSRLSLWEDSITSLLANPWIGYGINGVRSSKLFSDQNFQVTYVSSHNLFLDLFLWFGLVGGGIIFFYLLFIAFKIINNKEYGVFIFLTPFMIHCFFEYPFRYLYFIVLIIPVISLVKNIEKIYIRRSIFICLNLFFFGLILIFSIEFNMYSRSAFFAQSQKCERSNEDEKPPILMDLMYDYSQLYCGSLTENEMKRVVYRYPYLIHVKYYIEKGFYDEKLNQTYVKMKE